MIDREARRQVAELLRHLGSGAITNDYFDDHAKSIARQSQDLGVRKVDEWAWYLYAEVNCSRFRGRYRLPNDFRTDLARCVVFLHSDCEYEWPRESFGIELLNICLIFITALAGVVTIGFGLADSRLYVIPLALFGVCWWLFRLARARASEKVRRRDQLGDYAAWPFLRNDDLAAARAKPRLLAAQTA
ncbi:MAG: hypothetical protein K1X71_12315 [Pirellulales bacterium]|nr:hypothetical protein [Pirellulales bacterium]